MNFIIAPAVQKIMNELVKADFPSLVNVPIHSVFCDTIPKSKGADVWACMKKVSGLNGFLARANIAAQSYGELETELSLDYNAPIFILQVSFPVWEKLELDQRRALIDHELRHLFVDEDGVAKFIGHDVEEFAGNIKRYGLWRENLQNFFHNLQQMELFKE